MERENYKPSLVTPLIQSCEENGLNNGRDRVGEEGIKRKQILEEVKRQLWLAGPLIAVSLLQYCLQMISVMFVGHLGELSLSGASMATSFAAVTGFSFLVSQFFSLTLNEFSLLDELTKQKEKYTFEYISDDKVEFLWCVY